MHRSDSTWDLIIYGDSNGGGDLLQLFRSNVALYHSPFESDPAADVLVNKCILLCSAHKVEKHTPEAETLTEFPLAARGFLKSQPLTSPISALLPSVWPVFTKSVCVVAWLPHFCFFIVPVI